MYNLNFNTRFKITEKLQKCRRGNSFHPIFPSITVSPLSMAAHLTERWQASALFNGSFSVTFVFFQMPCAACRVLRCMWHMTLPACCFVFPTVRSGFCHKLTFICSNLAIFFFMESMFSPCLRRSSYSISK